MDDPQGTQYLERKRQRNQQRRKQSENGPRQKKISKKEQARIDRDLESVLKEINPIKEAAAKAAASTEKRPRLMGLGGQIFNLYSTDHVKHVPGSLDPFGNKIDFFENGDSEDPLMPVDGYIDIRMNNVCNLDRFIPPSYYSAGFHELQGESGNFSRRKVPVHFIDDNHLILKISRHMVFKDDEKRMPNDAPEIFTYYGIRGRYETEQKKKKKEEEKKARGRSETPEPPVRRHSFGSDCSRDMEYYM
ncbi:uncharacterized protein B0J16DRAFT_375445 [Fusarium flagelliforme]|uniref:Uncharacterized protein n=1 Tax=Fusarium flagelliforme TaxID=2675880 RepID=A0A395MK69_9HYPO|nr:uncharacterized protein B0J16DRAFT_375445 [Fusarium flagelliforme]KAH7174631.1 hypothetical protein B0J16DRAFT_375445 [Fusarium flagelliforme]RFN48332.1 hypothetical protein FIE12Z_7381 [Fusarium flagelliforme]